MIGFGVSHGAPEDGEKEELWQSKDNTGDGLEANENGAEEMALLERLQATDGCHRGSEIQGWRMSRKRSIAGYG